MFAGLEFLQILLLNNNQIKTLSKTLLLDCRSLRKLDLQHNQIDFIDPMFLINTSYLEELDLSHNKLFSDDLECLKHQNLQNIRTINLSFNNIFIIDFQFNIMSKLQYLNLSHNLIGPVLEPKNIDFRITFGLTVDLSYNNIETFDLMSKSVSEESKGKP